MTDTDQHTRNDDHNRLTGLAAIIPQLFYDVIARIIPGSVLLLLFFIIFRGPRLAQVDIIHAVNVLQTAGYPTFLLFIAGCILSYGISILLWQQFVVIEKIERTIKGKDGFATTDRMHSFRYDFIKHRDPAAGSRITKLSAEIHMTETFFMGFLNIVLLSLVLCGLSAGVPVKANVACDPGRYWMILLLLPLMAGSFLARQYFRSRADLAVLNCYEIHGGPEKLRDDTVMY